MYTRSFVVFKLNHDEFFFFRFPLRFQCVHKFLAVLSFSRCNNWVQCQVTLVRYETEIKCNKLCKMNTKHWKCYTRCFYSVWITSFVWGYKLMLTAFLWFFRNFKSFIYLCAFICVCIWQMISFLHVTCTQIQIWMNFQRQKKNSSKN